MLIDYIQAAMRRAKYEILEDDGSFFGSIPDLQGVWANEATLEECREERESALEDWILAGIWQHHPIPAIDGIDLNVTGIPLKPPEASVRAVETERSDFRPSSGGLWRTTARR